MVAPQGLYTGGAWLSSARVVRCSVKSGNERNPRPMLPARNGGNSWDTAVVNTEEGGGVYKARERIHRSVADLRLLATPTS